MNWGVGNGELRQYLPAGSARRAGFTVQIRNGDGYNLAIWAVLAYGAKQRVALSAACKAVGHIFNVTACDDAAIIEEQGCTHAKF